MLDLDAMVNCSAIGLWRQHEINKSFGELEGRNAAHCGWQKIVLLSGSPFGRSEDLFAERLHGATPFATYFTVCRMHARQAYVKM